MNEHKQRLREIAHHEQWLANCLGDEVSPSTEHLKLRIRVAIDEQWLSRRLDHQSEPVSASLRNRIQQSLATRQSQKSTLPTSNAIRNGRKLAASGLGLAAMLLFCLIVFRSNETEIADTDLPVLTAFEAATVQDEYDEDSGDLDAIDNQLAEISALMASLNETESDDLFEGL